MPTLGASKKDGGGSEVRFAPYVRTETSKKLSLVPRPVHAIRVTRGGLQPSAIESSANFPTSLTGDVTFEIAEDDWVRGWVDSRLKVPYSGFFINGRGIPDSKSSFPDFKPRDSGFHSKNLMQSGFQKQKFPRFRRGRVESKTSHSLFVQSHEREVCHRAP